jgi:uncharacterized protein with GYD domain
MSKYIVLLNWTDQGIREYHDTVKRSEAFAGELEKLGAKVENVFWTVGRYDLVAVVEAPDDETATAALLQTGSAGNVRSTTMRAFGKREFERIVAKAAG